MQFICQITAENLPKLFQEKCRKVEKSEFGFTMDSNVYQIILGSEPFLGKKHRLQYEAKKWKNEKKL